MEELTLIVVALVSLLGFWRALFKHNEQKLRADRATEAAVRLTDLNYSLEQSVRQLAGLITVDERGTTIAKGRRQWEPVLASAAHALGDPDLAEPLVFVTAEVNLDIPIQVPGA